MAPTPVELITPISSPPTFITRAEHNERTQATPASFADIPPVLVHREDGVKVELDPPLEGFTEADCAGGTLYIVESTLVFISSSGSSRGFEIKYPNITLHAISRSGDDRPCIYCQLDDVSGDDEESAISIPATTRPSTNGRSRDTDENQDDDDDDDEDEEDAAQSGHSTLRELKIIPQTGASLEPIFEALSYCASIHSDAVLDSDDDMGEDDAFIDADGLDAADAQELSEVGRAALDYLESIIEYPPGQPRPGASGIEETRNSKAKDTDKSDVPADEATTKAEDGAISM